MTQTTAPIRLDKWLWHARFAKTRKDAVGLIERRRVRINSEIIKKCHRQVRIGDVLTLALQRDVLVLRVLGTGERRGPASAARELYEIIETADLEAA